MQLVARHAGESAERENGTRSTGRNRHFDGTIWIHLREWFRRVSRGRERKECSSYIYRVSCLTLELKVSALFSAEQTRKTARFGVSSYVTSVRLQSRLYR